MWGCTQDTHWRWTNDTVIVVQPGIKHVSSNVIWMEIPQKKLGLSSSDNGRDDGWCWTNNMDALSSGGALSKRQAKFTEPVIVGIGATLCQMSLLGSYSHSASIGQSPVSLCITLTPTLNIWIQVVGDEWMDYRCSVIAVSGVTAIVVDAIVVRPLLRVFFSFLWWFMLFLAWVIVLVMLIAVIVVVIGVVVVAKVEV